MSITLRITEATLLIDSVSKFELKDDDNSSKTVISILKLHLFIMKKVGSGSNSVALVPALKKKLDELWFKYLEEIENDSIKGKISEGEYLEQTNSSAKERANTLNLLDMLELGLDIKCIII